MFNRYNIVFKVNFTKMLYSCIVYYDCNNYNQL